MNMNKKLLLLSFVFALLGFMLANAAIQAARAEDSVVVAARPIKPYTVIKQDDIKIERVSKSVSGDAFRTPDEVVGKVSLGMLLPGEPIRKGHVEGQSANRLSGTLPPGKVAVALPSSLEVTVSGSVRPGDEIDLYAVSSGSGVLVVPRAVVRSGSIPQESQGRESDLAANPSSGGLVLEIDEQHLRNFVNAMASSGKFFAVLRPLGGTQPQVSFPPPNEGQPVQPPGQDATEPEMQPVR